MIRTSRLPSTVPSPAPIAAIVWLHKMRSAARNTPASRASQRLRRGIGAFPEPRPLPRPRLCSRSAKTPSTGSANAHRPSATTLGEAGPASFISTAELEMQIAPAVAAATGGIVVTRTGLLRAPGARPRRLIPVRHALPEVAIQDRLHHLGERAALVSRG